ncbi:MAG: AI-2E family transporter [Acidobacteria bacterium]|nr:AI-2E family transporter [Acidobacteriota bacterium]
MDFNAHLRTTGTALRRWFIAQCYDALIVGCLWLVGLLIIRVPLAPFWALLGAAFQFVPNFGPLLAVAGPAITGGLSGGWERMLYVLILYAVIALADGLVLQPYIMRRQVKVPIWASIIAPIVLGIVIPFWGVLLAPPLLAVIYTYRAKAREQALALPPAPVIEMPKRPQIEDRGD